MEDAQKRRQMMMKGAPRPNFNKENSDADQRSASLLTSLEAQNCPTMWVANNGANGNPIIAVFPRIPLEEEVVQI